MPYSQQPYKGQLLMLQRIIERESPRVVDVGAGAGKWGKLIREATSGIETPPFLVAIEIWVSYLVQFGLHQIYDEVRVIDLRKVRDWDTYDVVILGDVLEHLSLSDALDLVGRLRDGSKAAVYLTIPITDCPQEGEDWGNPHETHRVQWTHQQLCELGWKQLHQGPNPEETVVIGTYELLR
jgi:hypothetical protein